MSSSFIGASDSGEYVGVKEYLTGKNLFITGCTGFVGKVLLEKIMRSCPGVKSIFVMGREKKGQSLQQRFTDIFNSALFDRLRKEQPIAIDKIRYIDGDLLNEGLGISSFDLETLRSSVNVVIHSAASVRFNEPLRNAVNMNLCGTKRILEFCSSLKQLEVLVHVSTCYANCDQEVVEERVYPETYEPEQVMQLVKWLDDEALAAIQSKFLGDKPNTYTFTKGLAEKMVKQFHRAATTRYEEAMKDAQQGPRRRSNSASGRNSTYEDEVSLKRPFSIAIVRPSIVVASRSEPMPGWVDNYNGPSGLIVATACGILRSLYSKKEMRTDFIPVDIVANTILVAAWHLGVFRPENVLVYNCAAGDRAPEFTWADLENYQTSLVAKVTFNNAIRYPHIRLRANWFTHKVSMLFEHYLPAIVADKVSLVMGKKPQFIKLYDKVTAMQEALTFFTTHEWDFRTEKVQRLRQFLSESDRQEFCIDLDGLNWNVYLQDYVRGLRDFVLKENHKQPSGWFQRLYLIEQLQKAALTIAVYKVLGIGDIVASVYETAVNEWL